MKKAPAGRGLFHIVGSEDLRRRTGAVVALQCRTVVVGRSAASASVIGGGIVGSGTPQRRPVFVVFVVLHLVPVLNRGQAPFDLVKFRRVHNVFVSRGKHGFHFLLRMFHAV